MKTDCNSVAILLVCCVAAVVEAITDESVSHAASVATVVIAWSTGRFCVHKQLKQPRS